MGFSLELGEIPNTLFRVRIRTLVGRIPPKLVVFPPIELSMFYLYNKGEIPKSHRDIVITANAVSVKVPPI